MEYKKYNILEPISTKKTRVLCNLVLPMCDKLIRRFRASWTLQSSDDANLKDLIKKLWLVSDPLFYSFRKTLKCPKYGSTGHQRKCPVMDTLEDKHEDDVKVEEMFVE